LGVGPVCAVAIVRGEAPYIHEFVRHHRAVGFSRFYLYDNGAPGEEPLAETLAAMADPLRFRDCAVIVFPGEQAQFRAHNHFVSEVLPRTCDRWVAVLDADEFVCPVRHGSVQAFLREHGHLGAVGLNWRMFGACGHELPPPGDVRSAYTRSMFHNHIKTLAHRDALLGRRVVCVHNPARNARRLDGSPIPAHANEADYTDVIRVNHYFTKSRSEFRAKCARGRADVAVRRNFEDYAATLEDEGSEEDTAILRYV
jgi:hypothetical protein